MEREQARAEQAVRAQQTHLDRLVARKRPPSTKTLILEERKLQAARKRLAAVSAQRSAVLKSKQWMRVEDYERVKLRAQATRARYDQRFKREASYTAPGKWWVHLPTGIASKKRTSFRSTTKSPAIVVYFTVHSSETKRVYDKRGRLTKKRLTKKETYIAQKVIALRKLPGGLYDLTRPTKAELFEVLSKAYNRVPKKGGDSDKVVVVLGVDYYTLWGEVPTGQTIAQQEQEEGGDEEAEG